jgi:DNA-binding response OmpR family regulator
VHILLATDADWIVNEVTAALGSPDTTFTVCTEGRVVSKVVAERQPDLAILDLQIGSMGGMAVTMALRLDESGGILPHTNVLMLLDRVADEFLAKRSGAEGWIVKPLDALRLQQAAAVIAAGGLYANAVPALPAAVDEALVEDAAADVDSSAAPEEEPAPAG